jgi:hypothetical protein
MAPKTKKRPSRSLWARRTGKRGGFVLKLSPREREMLDRLADHLAPAGVIPNRAGIIRDLLYGAFDSAFPGWRSEEKSSA